MKKGPTALTQSVSYLLMVMFCFILVGGSFILKLNWGEKATSSDLTIDYVYQNEGIDPQLRNHYRKIKIVLNSITAISSLNTKNVRIQVYREGAFGEPSIQNGKVFSVIMEDIAKFKSIIFDYNKCVKVNEYTTDIIIFVFKQYEDELALKAVIISIDRRTDKMTMLGKEITAEDVWSSNVANAEMTQHKVILDKGYLQLTLGGENEKDHK